MKQIITMLLLALALSGCTRFQQIYTDPVARQHLATRFGNAITIAMLAESPSAARDTAAKITRAATRIREVASSDITVSDFRTAILERAILLLDEEDRLRARIFTHLIISEIKLRFNVDLTLVPAGVGTITRELIIAMCDEAISAAALYLVDST